MQKETSTKIIKNLFLVFIISTVLLLVSIVSSLSSITGLIDSAKWVNHTNEVLSEAENLISFLKDAETGQRGFVITKNPIFLDPYAYDKIKISFGKLKELTSDNAVQQRKLSLISPLIDDRFNQLDKVLKLSKKDGFYEVKEEEMLKGKAIMDKLRKQIAEMKTEENRLLAIRTAKLDAYTRYAPILIVLAALLSIGITIVSFLRIRRETEDRLKKQNEDEKKYDDTSIRISQMEVITQRIANGDLAARSGDNEQDEIGRVSSAINKLAISLQKSFSELEMKNWLEVHTIVISDVVRGQTDVALLANDVIKAISDILNFQVGTFYVINSSGYFSLAAQHACVNPALHLKPGEGLTGEALKNKKTILVNEIPLSHLKLTSSIGESTGGYLLLLPLFYNKNVVGIMELGFIKKPSELDLQLLENCKEALGIGINGALSYSKQQELLEITQSQSEEMKTQHNELESLNVELEAQTQQLQASEEELRVQQEELLEANTELVERSNLLQERNAVIQAKAQELALTTKYKSEFLANMSHELRTPLNSILLLSRLLSDNKLKHLSNDEVEYAKVIQNSGNGLLNLINEILDLSQIETGKMELDPEETKITEVLDGLKSLFTELAKEKGIAFNLSTAGDLPEFIRTDKMRLEQILKNLISNAIKFTAKGSVKLHVTRSAKNNNLISFSVEDTGVGIPKDKHALIFEAFQQADGSTKRKYGGTGLGLSISKQLAKLLQGEITLNSEVNKGSEFVLTLPHQMSDTVVNKTEEINHIIPVQALPNQEPVKEQENKYISATIPDNVKDDREICQPGDSIILIIEDDIPYAKSLLEFTRSRGYKAIVCVRGDEAQELANHYQPKGILLDLELPVKSGWEVMDLLKKESSTKHIPVHMMSSHHVRRQSLLKGAVDFIEKPVAIEQMDDIFKKIENVLSKDSKKVLIVEDNAKHAEALAYYLETFNIQSEIKNNVNESIDALKSDRIDCVILDMGIPANNAYEVLENFKKDAALENLPIIVFTGKSLSLAEEQRIRKYADSIVIKTAYSYQRMLDEVSLFLHVVEEKKSTQTSSSFKKLGTLDQVLEGKTVLVTDDDVRNIFSLTKALESLNLKVLAAVNGKEALQKLQEHPEINVVLLDMMMPEMDGYETAKRIRENPKWKKLPVIALTAKAMTGDREKCISAGASDYISKPVDIDQLLSLLRVWLYASIK
ncbi:MAG: response regulator [Bacteroidia bacterium]|nr:response regulator [Bacteroidia bacterium]